MTVLRSRRRKAPSWTSQEVAVLSETYLQGGLEAAADALPDRSWGAITMMASKLGLRSPLFGKPREATITGAALEEAIRQREELGWAFARIGEAHGVGETAAQNAVLIALCPRKGFTPAERDPLGRLLPDGVVRLRDMLAQGRKGVEISLELGISVGRVALERRTVNAELRRAGERALPPPGAGARYSGAKIQHDVYQQVDSLLMKGYGAPRVAELTQVSKVQVGRRRNKLVKRLAVDGRCLPGCDVSGRRLHYQDSLASVTAEQRQVLRAELMKGTPVARAAKVAVCGRSFAYAFRDELKADLAAAGRSLPPIKRLGRAAAEIDEKLAWLKPGKANLILYRRMLKQAAGDLQEAKRLTIAALMPKPVPAPPKRPLTFEEKLAKLARGEARLVQNVPLRRAGYAGTLGGVASGML